MPKLNITHLPERLKERLAKLERGEEVALKDINALLDDEQIERMDKAWAEQEVLRKTHKRPKTKEQEQALGWKTKLEVRIEIYKQAIVEAQRGMVDGIRKLQKEREAKAARIWLDAVFKAGEGTDKWSAGNIALTRAGFNKFGANTKKRDKEVWAMEDALRKEFEGEMSKEEKEQLELLKEHQKALKKKKR
jgi:hypothetical protein